MRQIIGANRLKQITRIRPHDRNNPHGGGYVGQNGMRILRNMPRKPVEILRFCLCPSDDEIGRLRQPRDRQIRFNPTLVIEPLGVNQLARCHIDVIGAHAVQDGTGIAPFQPEFRKGALVKQAHSLAHGLALFSIRLKPVLTAIAICICGRAARRAIPIGAFPAKGFPMASACSDQPIMNGRAADATRGFILLERIMRRVQQPKALGHALTQIFPVNLERHVTANIDRPQISRRNSVADPIGHNLANAACGLQADGVKARRDKAAL